MSVRVGPTTPKRTCDICGVQRDAAPGVFRVISKRWVCSYHANWMAYEVEDQEKYQTFGAKPLKDARPFTSASGHGMEESVILSFLSRFWNYQNVNGGLTGGGTNASSAQRSGDSATTDSELIGQKPAAAWTAIYCAAIVQEAKAPLETIATAKAILLKCVTWLSTTQKEGPNSGGSSANAIWGAWTGTTGLQVSMVDQAAMGTALLRGYQVFGTASFLTAAAAAVSHALLMFRADAWNGLNGFATPFTRRLNAPPNAYTYSAGTYITGDPAVHPSSLLYLEFLSLYQTIAGDLTITSAATTYYTGNIDAKVSEMTSRLRAFWSTPTGTIPKVGLSSTTPRSHYNGSATQDWAFNDAAEATGTTIYAVHWAYAIRGLYAYEGVSTQVADMFDFLMASTSNPTYKLPTPVANRMISGYDETSKWSSRLGDYTPSLTGIVHTLKVREDTTYVAVNRNDTDQVYAWTTGIMGAVFASRKPAGLELMKTAHASRVPIIPTTTGGRKISGWQWLPLTLNTGLSYQFGGLTLLRPEAAACFGLVYRHGKQAFPYRGHA